jgi:hypothetical protein
MKGDRNHNENAEEEELDEETTDDDFGSGSESFNCARRLVTTALID